MKFPKRYIRRGKFKLHSGKESDIFYDVVPFLTENMRIVYDTFKIDSQVNRWVGIVTGGALIACQNDEFGIVHNGRYIGKTIGSYILIDDVVTTESSIKEAIEIIGKKPKMIFCVLDRRKKKTLKINAIYDAEEK